MWLLYQLIFDALESAMRTGAVPSAEAQVEFSARYEESFSDSAPRILSVAGDSAEIRVQGVLTKRPDYMAAIYGGGNTTYGEICAAIAAAEQNKAIKNIIFSIDSPGGQVDGLFETIAAMQAMKKPTKALVSGMAASAAYALASQCNNIEAGTRASRFGSIGILATFRVWPEDVSVTSTKSPKKAPNVTTEAGKAIVREELDAMYDLFVESIAAGRGVDTKKVEQSFGSGATILADEALSRGMIDSIAPTSLKSVQSVKQSAKSASTNLKAETDMDLAKLKAEHPAVYAAAVAEGQAKERDRVSSHLVLGQSSGDMKLALEAIEKGEEMNATYQSKYMAAGMNKRDLANREEDKPVAAANAAAATDNKGVDDSIEKQVAAQVAASHGLGAVA